MKLANPQDRRSLRDYKKSCTRFSSIYAPNMELRLRNPRISPDISVKPSRHVENPFKTKVGSSHGFQRKLRAAAACRDHGVQRMVPLSMLPQYQEATYAKQLLCKLCLSRGIRQLTSWACITCGAELCIVPQDTGSNRYPNLISCADASHQQNKINIENLTVKRQSKDK